MFRSKKLVAILCILLVGAVLVSTSVWVFDAFSLRDDSSEPVYVGVAFCGNTTSEAKLLIDRVKSYTNLFVLQSGPISNNETAINEICDYAVDAGLYLVVYFGDLDSRFMDESKLWRLPWLSFAKEQWGDRLLGVHYYDEPGGIYVDANWTQTLSFRNMTTADANYSVAAQSFLRGFQGDLGFAELKANDIDVYVSEYALHWFDYLAGYDVVWAQIGWNHSTPQAIGLVRGAANLQNKSWGAIITWRYMQPPYLDSGEKIYGQMSDAYRSGAKYIVIFNYPSLEGNPYGVILDEHFEALERFWTDTVNNPQVSNNEITAEAALVLPKDYGWGMRRPDDRIWGWWGPDEQSPQIWALSQELLNHYGLHLDIVYDDPAYPTDGKYTQIYYWNQILPQTKLQ